MALSEALNRLMEQVRKAPDNYERTLEPFPQLDLQKLVAQFAPEAKGAERGAKGLPPPRADTLDEVENEIVEYIERERASAHRAFLNQLQTYDERIANLDFESRFSVVTNAGLEAVADFRVDSKHGQDDLFQHRRNVIELTNERDEFRRKHRLTRTASYPRPALKAFKYGFLAFLFVFEIVVNSVFLAKGNELGLVGGTVEATIFAALNILATALLTFVGMRFLYHRSILAKLYGFACLMIFVVLTVALNLALAHYREVSGAFLDTAGAVVWQRLWTSTFEFSSITSWLFFAIGVLCSVAAALDVLSLEDRYPGYGALDRRVVDAQEKFIETKNSLREQLEGIREKVTTALDTASRDLQVRRTEYEVISDRRSFLIDRYRSHMTHLQRVGHTLLTHYRTANLAARKAKMPEYFKNHKYQIDLSAIDALGTRADRLVKLDEAIAEARAGLNGQIVSIHKEFEEAATRYQQLESLASEKAPKHEIAPAPA